METGLYKYCFLIFIYEQLHNSVSKENLIKGIKVCKNTYKKNRCFAVEGISFVDITDDFINFSSALFNFLKNTFAKAHD